MVALVLVAPVAAFVVALACTAALVRVGHRLRALDSPGSAGHVKRELRAVPNIGGVAIAVAVLGPLLVGGLLLRFTALAESIPALAEHADRLRHSAPAALALAGTALVLHLMGLIDDRRGLSPWPKLAIQAGCALVLALWFEVRLLEFLGPAASIAITVAWIVAVTNAMNFIDNMDGLSAGVGMIAGGLFMVAAIVNAQWFIAGTLGLLVGALGGFLVFNFPPARIFMGDGGSLVLGYLLAVLTARTTYYDPAHGAEALGSAWYGVLMPLVVLAVPLYDFVTVTALRVAQGKSPFVGDQQHFSHRLVKRGLSRRGAVGLIWAFTAVTGIGGISLGRLLWWQAALVGVQTLAVLGTIWTLEHASRHAVRDPGADES